MSESKITSIDIGNSYREACRQYLTTKPDLREFLVTNGSFRPQDLEAVLNMDASEVRATVNTMWGWHMLRNVKGMIQAQPVLNEILRED